MPVKHQQTTAQTVRGEQGCHGGGGPSGADEPLLQAHWFKALRLSTMGRPGKQLKICPVNFKDIVSLDIHLALDG